MVKLLFTRLRSVPELPVRDNISKMETEGWAMRRFLIAEILVGSTETDNTFIIDIILLQKSESMFVESLTILNQ